MGIENRPFAGTWNLTGRKFIKYTPDCIIMINGDTTLPGCSRCSGRIDLQQFIINVSVDSGVDAGASSANVGLSIPREFESSIFRDNNFILQPGLEIHIYMRGIFPVEDLYGAEESRSGLETLSAGLNLSGSIVNPYYQVFHGVVIDAKYDYSGGFYNANITCGSMLHFWQYQPITTNASIFGARPTNSKMKSSLVGHNFTGMTPFSIIYSLYRDTNGHPASVGFTLGQKTNISATNPVNPSQSIFSLAQKYWQKRFSTRINNLRIYGATGTLFNSAQQAFISKLSTSQISRIVATQYKDPNSWPNDPNNPFYAAQALDLIRYTKDGQLIKPFDVTLIGRSSIGSNAGRRGNLGINLGALQAFVSDLGQYGNVNQFESTYENKLDIANKVVEITGFEFYQDVDGDFVFKPPFYNLDTSDNRVYRIEPIDLIQASYGEKEPQATYMVAKGAGFQNLNGTGLENEWGQSGKYFDYRLIAKYGWRPGSFETSYLSSSREMFWAAVNRLDVMNATVNSASISIPLRPELRPGMPVYIQSEDCYYYLRGFSHSFQFGGQCTTSLTLDAKRAKFYAPGDPNKEGIDSINLSSPDLPKKSLSVIDDAGSPRESGFPNVVMALDPTQTNPLFHIVGSDAENITTDAVRRNLIAELRDSNGLEFDITENMPLDKDIFEDGKFVIRVDNENTIRLDTTGTSESSQRGIVLTEQDFKVAAKRYQRFEASTIKNKKKLEREISSISGQISNARKIDNDKRRETTLRRLRSKLESKQKALDGLINKANRGSDDESVRNMLAVLEARNKAYRANQQSDIADLNSTANLLDIIGNKKSSFTNGQIPGYYRYYSSSHPDPENQGQRILNISAKSNTPAEAGNIQPLDTPIKTRGFLKTPTRRVGGAQPEAEFGNIDVGYGFNVLFPGDISNTRRVPTRDITTLTFVQHAFDYNINGTFITPESNLRVPQKLLEKELKKSFLAIARLFGPDNTTTLGDVWGDKVDEINEAIQTSLLDYLILFADNNYGRFLADPFYAYGNDDFSGRDRPLGNLRSKSINRSIQNISSYLAKNFAKIITLAYGDRISRIKDEYGNTNEVASTDTESFIRRRDEAYASLKNDWNSLMVTAIGKPLSINKPESKGKRRSNRNSVLYSPVFPVSDHKGYEVIGSYRYGRGLTIDKGGTFDTLLNDEDPFRYQDLADVETFVQSLIRVTSEREDGSTLRSNLSLRQKAELAQRIGAKDAEGNTFVLDDLENATSAQADQFDVKFSNWIETAVNSNDRLTVANAAFTLSDLNAFANKNVCACRAAEADIALPAFGNDAFMVIEGTSDSVAAYAKNIAANQTVTWQNNQDAIRGRTRDRNYTDFGDLARAYRRNAESTFNAAQEQLSDIEFDDGDDG